MKSHTFVSEKGFSNSLYFIKLYVAWNQGTATGRANRPGYFRPGEKYNFEPRTRPETRIFKFSAWEPARNPETRAGSTRPFAEPCLEQRQNVEIQHYIVS